MKNICFAEQKIYTLEQLRHLVAIWQMQCKTFSLIDGYFNVLDMRTIRSLNEAAKNSDFLIVAVYSDASAKNTSTSAFNKEEDRAQTLANLLQTDAIVIIDQPDIQNIIASLKPNTLMKSSQYEEEANFLIKEPSVRHSPSVGL